MINKIAIIVFALTITSCQNDDLVKEPAANKATTPKEEIVLGKKLKNPYSIFNMKKALKNLQDQGNKTTAITIKPTHYYVRFDPKTEENLTILKNTTNLELYPYPLDYEIKEDQNHYHDADITTNEVTYQYAAIKVEQKLPEVPYEILEELFIPEIKSNVKGTASKSINFLDDLEEEALKITDNLDPSDKSISGEVGAKRRRRRWTPTGKIHLHDNTTKTSPYIPLAGAKVRARRWFTTHTGYTDRYGNFRCNGSFKREANYSIVWESNDFDIRSGELGQALFNGPKRKGPWNLDIASGASRMYAIVHHAAYNYYYGNRKNLKSPPRKGTLGTKIKIAVFNKPNKTETPASHCKDCRFLGILSRLRIWNDGRNVSEIYGSTIHELAHASHWELRKNNWGDKQTSKKVKETWASGLQWELTRLKYPKYERGYSSSYTGLVKDLIDGTGSTRDNVKGYKISDIEKVMSKVSNFSDWESELKNKYTNSTENKLGPLFDYWDTYK